MTQLGDDSLTIFKSIGPDDSVTIPIITGVKYDGGKPRMGLLPQKALIEVAKVLTFGAKKYAPDNWRKVPELRQRYYDAALRHLADFKYEENDKESGLSHLAHAMCCLSFILEDSIMAKENLDVLNV